MVSVKRPISVISLDKNLSMSSHDLLTTGIREKISRTIKCEQQTNGVDIDPNCLHYRLWRSLNLN